jgi:hypothetical protein
VRNKRRPAHRMMRPWSRRLAAVSAGAIALVLLVASSAFASSEQVGTFGGVLAPPVPAGDFPEYAQLGGAMGVAINRTGAGGVAPGTVYVATMGDEFHEQGLKIDRFSPKGEFELAWSASQRCGPIVAGSPCPSRADGTEKAPADVEVDQATGDVYTFSGEYHSAGIDEIDVYNATGTELIAEFGLEAPAHSTIAETPGDLHRGYGVPQTIAVDSSGRVYVYDAESAPPQDYRLMIFEPETPGDYKHYVYVGNSTGVPSRTLGVGNVETQPSRPVLNDAGDVYTAEEGFVREYDPRAASPVPLCTLKIGDAGVRGMTVNPETGDVYYYDYKDNEVHKLSGQCGANGRFAEVESFPLTPQRGYPEAMAFNPTLAWEAGGPRGVLYVVAPDGTGEASGGELGASALGYVFAPAVSHVPVVDSESTSRVSSTSATLEAVIDPKRASTEYVFEYLTDAAYEANEPTEPFAGASRTPVNGASIGNSSPATAVSVTVSGLAPMTEYRYRVVATSTNGTAEGAVQSFSTFPLEPGGLADDRAYELVTPIEKHGGEPFPLHPNCGGCKPGEFATKFPVVSAADGEALAYEGSSFSGRGGAIENEYLSKRNATGWQTTDLSPSSQGSGEAHGFTSLDGSLGRAVIYQRSPSLASTAPVGYNDLYLQDTGDPLLFSPLLTEPPFDRSSGNSSANSLALTYVGASNTLSKVFFEANDALTRETPFAPPAVDGGASKKNLYEWANGQLRLVNVAPGNMSTEPGGGIGSGQPQYYSADRGVSYAVSENGSRVFWSSEAGQAYVRIDGERTVEIPDHTARFVTASADGSKALLSDGRIYAQLESGPVEEGDLTEGKEGFAEVLGQSEDLSYVYYVDTAKLNTTPNQSGATAQEGRENLYVWHADEIAYIATLRVEDNVERAAEASPNGNWFAFPSKASPTGFDNNGDCGKPCSETYVYHDSTGSLTCTSCSPSQALPLGESYLPVVRGQGESPQPHYVSDSGRMFFDTQNALSSLDNNGRVEDVYEFEPQGVGSCTQEDGCVSLISAGTGTVDSNFLAMDPSGRDVFFTTRDQLTAGDGDQELDIYDAREGGGISSESLVQPEECRGEACQGASPALPVASVPGSLAFSGPGNLITPPPISVVAPKPKAKALTRGQKLAVALRACKRKRGRARASCERSARQRFGSKANARKAANNRRKAQ